MDTLKFQAYTTIKEKIIHCEYPPNSLLNEERLKEELEISRTPIRDALSRLEQESLIQILPRRGIMVRGISPDEVEQVYDMRLLIEPYALKKYGKKIDRKILAEMDAFFSRKSAELANEAIHKKDDEFHDLFIKASGNIYIIEAYKFVYIQNFRLRILSGNLGRERMRDSRIEHQEIIRWCLKEKWGRASEQLTAHLLNSREASYNSIRNLQVLLRREVRHSAGIIVPPKK